MPAYKDKKRNTWYASFYYTDYNGDKRLKKKRGFKTQREAKDYEREFLLVRDGNPQITFETLCQMYLKDSNLRNRNTTYINREYIIRKHILPFFENRAAASITTADIRNWQNQILEIKKPSGEHYSQSYIRTINDIFNYIINYGSTFCGIKKNPCNKVKKIGTKKTNEMNFWTLEQFEQFIVNEKKVAYKLAFTLLFWTGMRIGELLALSESNIIHSTKSLEIKSSYHRIKRQDIIGPTKTDKTRITSLPDFVYNELCEYVEAIYNNDSKDRIFYFTQSAVNHEMTRLCNKIGMEKIRVHDLRHSHVSLLIDMNYSISAIADRIGDTPETVMRTYAHLYPDTRMGIAQDLENYKFGAKKQEN